MFLTADYFKNDIYLPIANLNNIQSSNPEDSILYSVSNSSINDFIDEYEPLYLQSLLGDGLYRGFIEGMKELSPEQLWQNMYDEIYGNKKRCAPACFVYFMVNNNSQSITTFTGEQINHPTRHVSGGYKAQQAFNVVQEITCEFWNVFMKDNRDIYIPYSPDYYPEDVEIKYSINMFGI